MGEKDLKDPDNLDPGVHGALLGLLRQPKAETGTDATEKERLTLYRQAANRIAKNWASGTDDRLQKGHSAHYQKLLAVDEKLNQIWLSCRKSGAVMDDFKRVLGDWETFHKEGIELVKSKGRNNERLR